MADTDPCVVHSELERKKAIDFSDFVFGVGEGSLDAKLLESANLTFLDLRYKVLPKGTRLYNKQSGDDRVLVFSTTVDTMLSVLEPHLDEWRESEEVACFRAFEITQDIRVVEVREDIAKEVCLLWCLSASDGQTEETSTGADTAEAASVESGRERLMYKRLLDRSDRTAKNLLDHCFSTLPQNVSAILFRRTGTLQGGTLISANNMRADFVRDYQNIIVPQKLVDRLTMDNDGYLELRASPQVPTNHTQHNGTDGVDGLSVSSSEAEAQEKVDQPGHSVEPIPNFDSVFPNIDAEDAMDDYASIQFTTPSKTTTPKVTTTPAITPGVEAAKPLSPRPGQPPPPPPVAEPVYGIVDKAVKKPRAGRTESLDLPDTPGGTGPKPPRPPPVDSMPHDVQQAGGNSPAHSHGSIKPSRPSAPPKRKGPDRAVSVDSINMGSSGNVSLDGKDENLVPPPRGKSKKGDTTRF